jgi:energy-converting hydrogenase Eha subunit F
MVTQLLLVQSFKVRVLVGLLKNKEMKVVKIGMLVVGVLLMTGLLVPYIIKGFFWLILQGMKSPLEATIILTTFLTFYIIGMNKNNK